MKTLLTYVLEREELGKNRELVDDFINELDSTEVYPIGVTLINKYLNIKAKKCSLDELIKSLGYKESTDYIYRDSVLCITLTSFKLGLISVKSKCLKLFLLLDDTVNMYKKRLFNEQIIEISKLQNNNGNQMLVEYETRILENEAYNIKQEELIIGLEGKIKLLEDLLKIKSDTVSTGIITDTVSNTDTKSDDSSSNIIEGKKINDHILYIKDYVDQINSKLDLLLNNGHEMSNNLHRFKSTIII